MEINFLMFFNTSSLRSAHAMKILTIRKRTMMVIMMLRFFDILSLFLTHILEKRVLCKASLSACN